MMSAAEPVFGDTHAALSGLAFWDRSRQSMVNRPPARVGLELDLKRRVLAGRLPPAARRGGPARTMLELRRVSLGAGHSMIVRHRSFDVVHRRAAHLGCDLREPN
jgi:hypothetical protein